MRIVALLPVAAALALAACSKDKPEELMEANNAIEEPVDAEPAANNAAAPAENLTNEVPPAAPPPEFSDDEQMRDDADATGLTARLPSESESGSGENQTRPAE